MDRPTAAPDPTHAASRPGAPPWLPLLVLLAAWGAHGSALQTRGWVLDDAALVRDHTLVSGRGVEGLGRAFARDAWPGEAEHGAWRPVATLSFALEAPLWRDDRGRVRPFGFHLTNLFLHGLACILLLAALLALLPTSWPAAAFATLLFAVHPLYASTVSLLAGRAELLALVFALSTVLLWLRAVRAAPALLPLVGLAWLLALLSSEAAVGLPLVLLLLSARTAAGQTNAGPRARARFGFAILGLTFAVWLVLWPGRTEPFPHSLLLGLEAIARGVLGVLLPVGLVTDPVLLRGGGPSPGGLGLAGLVILGGLALLRAPGSFARIAGRGFLAFVLLTLAAAVVAAPGYATDVRILYVTGAGLFVGAGALLALLVGSTARLAMPARALGGAAALLVLVGLAAVTWHATSTVYADDPTYHRYLLRRHPHRPGLQRRYARRLRLGADHARRVAQTLPSDDPDRGRLLASIPRHLAEAEALLRAATRRSPDDAAAWRELGAVALARGDAARASIWLRQGLVTEPWLQTRGRAEDIPAPMRRELAATYLGLGQALEALGDQVEAAQQLTFAARLAPEDPAILRKAGVALTRAKRYREAWILLELALSRATTAVEADAVARALEDARRGAAQAADAAILQGARAEERNEPREAVAAYEAALEADPTRIQAYLHVARIRGEFFGDYRRAFAVLDRAEGVLDEAGVGPDDPNRRHVARQREVLAKQQAEELEEERRLEEGDGG